MVVVVVVVAVVAVMVVVVVVVFSYTISCEMMRPVVLMAENMEFTSAPAVSNTADTFAGSANTAVTSFTISSSTDTVTITLNPTST